MTVGYIIGQTLGILGFTCMFLSYQSKRNSLLFIFQGLVGFFFALNYYLIGDMSASLFNIVVLIRGFILSQSKKRLWEVIVLEVLFTACFIFSLTKIWGVWLDVALSCLTFSTLIIMTIIMWKANAKHIRFAQLFYVSPVWLTNNIIHFTPGGVLCEILAMSSVVVSFIRYGKNGFEQ